MTGTPALSARRRLAFPCRQVVSQPPRAYSLPHSLSLFPLCGCEDLCVLRGSAHTGNIISPYHQSIHCFFLSTKPHQPFQLTPFHDTCITHLSPLILPILIGDNIPKKKKWLTCQEGQKEGQLNTDLTIGSLLVLPSSLSA